MWRSISFLQSPLLFRRRRKLHRTFATVPMCSNRPTSAYIHIPFCKQRCAYCDFTVKVSTRESVHESYVDILEKEIRAISKHYSGRNSLATVYFGGGTPSLLRPDLLARIMEALDESFGISPGAEVTCEMDPGTFDAQKACDFHALGINRVSVGVQSFDDNLLNVCGRLHNTGDIHVSIGNLRAAGFRNISLDLISGLPHQTISDWTYSLRAAVQLEPDHISAYDLALEPGTAFSRKFHPGIAPLPSEEQSVEMILEAAKLLDSAGYERYEISNFAKRQFDAGQKENGVSRFCSRSQHNMAYWRNKPFYGFGVGATSLVDGFRFARPRQLRQYRDYVSSLEDLAKTNSTATSAADILYPHCKACSVQSKFEDFIINGLRLLVDGINICELEKEFGKSWAERFFCAVKNSGFVENGYIEIRESRQSMTGLDSLGQNNIRLTENGALIENAILAALLEDTVSKC